MKKKSSALGAILIGAIAILFLFACSSKKDTDGPSPNPEVEPPESVEGLLPSSGSREISECSQLGSGDQSCFWHFQLNPKACSNNSCQKLVIFFAGGQNTCPDPTDDDSDLALYVRKGYIAVCARIYEDSEGSAEFPYYLENQRVDLLVQKITSDSIIQNSWSGHYLLFSGVSHGATAPVISMARDNFDQQSHWKGSRYTAACFFDGVYGIQPLILFLNFNDCYFSRHPDNPPIVSFERVADRYGCDPSGPPCLTTDTVADSLVNPANSVTVDISDFAIQDWKLIECGSGGADNYLNRCIKDVLPASTIVGLCQGMDDDPNHSCELRNLPAETHIFCSRTEARQCQEWFDARLP